MPYDGFCGIHKALECRNSRVFWVLGKGVTHNIHFTHIIVKALQKLKDVFNFLSRTVTVKYLYDCDWKNPVTHVLITEILSLCFLWFLRNSNFYQNLLFICTPASRLLSMMRSQLATTRTD